MKKSSYLLCLALMLTACASTPTEPKQNIPFMDLEVFDNSLHQSMQAGKPDITVNVMGDLTVNKIPDRLGNWLSVMMEKGELDYVPQTKSLELLAFLPVLYDYVKEQLKYRPANDYHATVFYQQSTGKIDKIVFHKK